MPAAAYVWDEAAFTRWMRGREFSPQMAIYRGAALVAVRMKALCPVSKVAAVYATGGAVTPGGRRGAGDFPLAPSGFLRKSIVRAREPDGSWVIGPTAKYARYVNDGTPPHPIDSTGPWPLRNRVTGQVFGRHVQHPGTQATHFVERSLSAVAGLVVYV